MDRQPPYVVIEQKQTWHAIHAPYAQGIAAIE